ncbi:hypothetical protein ONZ51_g11527 [Trametes cubensis]|uniref:Uncharacterized protein n=1 Tax=Trametes cubensis TaxID=1111947 RepID=A0AAD7THD0_9APHY|nr:hypothetical protein ONZ51_g11527 [Trametes cubensis]
MVYTRTCLTECHFAEASQCNVLRPPNFICERRTAFYNHLPQHTISSNNEGTLTDCIGWVIVHPDLHSHVEAQIAHLPKIKDLIEVYHALTRATPSYSVLVNHNQRTSAPKLEKKKVFQVTSESSQVVVQAAEKVISMLANPQVARALSDLMPLRNQHGTHSWGHVFWSQCFDDYPQPIKVDSLNEEEDENEVHSNGGWSIPSTDPWKVSTPDPEEEAIKWGPTSVEGLTPTLSLSQSDSPYSEVESFNLLPELDQLELSKIDGLLEEEFHEALKVTVRAPSPPPPPTAITKHVKEPHGECGFFRGTREDQFRYINSTGNIFMVPNNPFGISVTRIMVAYHFEALYNMNTADFRVVATSIPGLAQGEMGTPIATPDSV